MPGSLPAVLGLALIDSINPSALVMTLVLLARSVPLARISSYIGGIFVSYLALGILLMLGIDALLTTFRDAFETPAAYAAQGVLGAAMLLYSFKPKRTGDEAGDEAGVGRGERRAERVSNRALIGMFALGALITVAEFPTAFPYLGAIALLTGDGLGPAQWLGVLLVYNVIFVLPPTLLVLGHRFAGQRLGPRYDRLRGKLQSGAEETALWIIGTLGFLLLFDALSYFEVFNLGVRR